MSPSNIRIKNFTSFLAILLLVVAHSDSIGQRLNLKHYKLGDGLASEELTTVIQSENGYIWFGTIGNGVFRFDGLNSKRFGSSQGLNGDTVEVIFQDSNRRIWAAMENGGIKMITQDTVYYPFLYQPINYSRVNSIRESQNNSLWFGTNENGLFIRRDNNFQHLTGNNSNLKDNRINDIWVQDSSRILIATHSGLSMYNGKSFTNFTEEFSQLIPRKLFVDNQKKIWIGTAEGLYHWTEGSMTEITDSQNQSLGEVTDIVQNRKGDLVIGTAQQGILIIGEETTTRINTNTGLNSNRIVDLYLDVEQKVWILTNKEGAYLLRDEAFIQYSGSPSLEAKNIYSIEDGPGNAIWFATNQGLMQWKKKSSGKLLPLNLLGKDDIRITDMTKYPNGDLLLLTAERHLIRSDGTSYRYISAGNVLGKDGFRVFDIFVNSKGELLAGTNQGLFHFSKGRLNKFDTSNGLPHNNVWNIMEDRQNKLWISTSMGLRILNNGSLHKLTSLEKFGSGKFYRNTVQDYNGNYWLGTNEGIIYYHPGSDSTTTQIKLLSNNDGLLSVDTQFLLVDNSFLWHGTTAGLHKINLKQVHDNNEIKVVHYGLTSRGLGVAFNHGAAIKYGSGKLWFGSNMGAIQYDAEANQIHNPGPVIHITDVELNFEEKNGKRYTTSVFNSAKKDTSQSKRFSYFENNFSFNFQALDYSSPEKVLYQYKLEGKDTNWSSINRLKKIRYSSLEPGSYTFKVKARNSHGVWSTRTASYSFTINPPFWETSWFIGISILTLISIIYGGTKIWLHTYEKRRLDELVDKQTEELKKGLHEKKILLAEIHHRVKNNLAVISGLVELQKAEIVGPKAIRAMEETQNRVKSIAMIHEKLYKSEMFTSISLDKYINELVEVISNYHVEEKGIKTKIDTEEVQVTLDQSIPCGLILNELLNNAYEHAFTEESQEGEIKISLEEVSGTIHLRIADNGVGLPEEFNPGSSTSLGLKLVNVLTQQLEGDLTAENKDGSTFHISFKKKTSTQGPIKDI